MSVKLGWKVHTTDLFEEISANFLQNPQIRIPLQILRNLLAQVAQRATELNDPQLNKLMIRLTLYSIADPKNKDYDPKLVEQILNENSVEEAVKHHKKHGDMDGHICLLDNCALHYPKSLDYK